MNTERGSLTVELVLLSPLLAILVLFCVHAGRLGEAKNQVQHAADQGARKGSQVSHSRIENEARKATLEDLSKSGIACINSRVEVMLISIDSFDAVQVNVTCDVRSDGTELLGLFPDTVHASSVEVIDRWRVL